MNLSVIIPTYNRSFLLASLLNSLSKLERVHWDWEVIVVDNGSTDNTAEVVEQSKCFINVKYVYEERPGLHQGRNRGAIEAKGKYIAYLDDDMLLNASWLSGVQMFEDRNVDAVVGKIIPKWESEPPRWLIQLCSNKVFGPLALLDLGDKPAETNHFFGCNIFIPRHTVIDFGGFHPDGMPNNLLKYRGDGETGLWLKMHAQNKKLWYCPTATAFHKIPQSRMTVEYMKKRLYNQGISDSFTNIRKHYGLYENGKTGLKYYLKENRNLRSYRYLSSNIDYLIARLRAKTPDDRMLAYVQYQMVKGFIEGWNFHRRELKKEPDLFKHVIRENFLEQLNVSS
jgi:glycosyltransferase involved in cell wall biosynthesis